MRTDDFDYHLPDDAIAQRPAEPRDGARLLDAIGVEPVHRTVADLPKLVGPGDVVVVNSTRVLPARLRMRKPTGGVVEVLLLEERDDGSWEALVRPSRKVAPGTRLEAGPELAVTIGDRIEDGRRLVTLATSDLLGALAVYGTLPLPPYIRATLDDPERYQTVFARRPGSVAAPTAGLHLTDAVLDGIRDAGATIATVDLWVGLGTFRPITAERIDDHVMHSERYEVPTETAAAVETADRVIAVGTTTVRALESWARDGRTAGRTDLYLTPGSRFRVVDVLMTNFHLPRSSLLVLIESFAGAGWRDLYATALADGYRFLSFGDAMLLRREDGETA